MKNRFLPRLAAGAALLALLGGASLPPPVEQVTVSTQPIAEFRIGHADKAFGLLEFNGGLSMHSWSADFGALSGLRFLDRNGNFIGVADTGFWFSGRVERDSGGHPAGIADFRMQEMVNKAGHTGAEKWFVDAESLAVRNGVAVAGFERNHRISAFRIDSADMGPPIRDIPFLIPKRELRSNRSFEALAFRPDGGLVLVTERSLDAQGNILAAVLEGEGKGVFAVKRNSPFDVSDAAFLPDGDLLLLERSFSIASGVGIRLRRIPAALLRKGALADGPVLLLADMGFQIDNMEALDVWRREDGALVVSMMSDDNHSMLQRNLYLEFILHEDKKPS